MNSHDRVVIFIGSGEASVLERKVLIHSLKKHSKRNLDIRVFNGTHDTLETEGNPPHALRLPLGIKYANITEFSNYRFLIPHLCGFKGRAIWLDSDMLCLSDIGELFDSDMKGFDLLAKENAYVERTDNEWGLSVSLFNCSTANFDVSRYFDEIEKNLYTYGDLHQMTPRFLSMHPYKIGPLNPKWNEFDFLDKDTKLIHYTNLFTQPWKYRSHPYGDIWFKYFQEARDSGYITADDIQLTLVRSYARRDLLEGNSWTIGSYIKRMASETKAGLRCFKAKLHVD